MEQTGTAKTDGFHIAAAFIVTGDVLEIHDLLERLEAFVQRYGARIAYQTTGARDELRIVRGRGP